MAEASGRAPPAPATPGAAATASGSESGGGFCDDDMDMASVASTASDLSEVLEVAELGQEGDRPAGQPADSPGDQKKVEVLPCIICKKNPRMKNQTFCASPCAADVKAAERDAQRRSGCPTVKIKGQALFVPDPNSDIVLFRKLKKQGNDEFRNAILSYKVRCAGHGRGAARPSFDWVRYYMCLESGSRMQQGTKSIWMTNKQFIAFLTKQDEYDPVGAELEFNRRLNDKDVTSDTKGPNSTPRLLVPIEEFVINMNEKAQLERTEWGVKDKKNPTDGDIQALQDIMGTDHYGFDSDWFKDVGGGSHCGANTFAQKSTVATPAPSHPSPTKAPKTSSFKNNMLNSMQLYLEYKTQSIYR